MPHVWATASYLKTEVITDPLEKYPSPNVPKPVTFISLAHQKKVERRDDLGSERQIHSAYRHKIAAWRGQTEICPPPSILWVLQLRLCIKIRNVRPESDIQNCPPSLQTV